MKMRTCVATALALSAPAIAAPVLWPSAQGGNDHYYDWVPGYHTWPAAKAAAESSTLFGTPGYLATLTSPTESAFLETHFSQDTGRTLIGWLGGFQDVGSPAYSEPSGGWSWVTAEPFLFTKWWTAQGLPDNFNGRQHYLRTQPVGPNIFWDDIEPDPGPSYISGYFIEYAVPEPSAAVLLSHLLLLLRTRTRGR